MPFGSVIDAASGVPLAGVIVSNGRECVATGADGRFELPVPSPTPARNGGVADRFVMIGTPAGYRPETPDGWYRNVTSGSSAEIVFRLHPDQRRAGDTFSCAQLTDLHVGAYPAEWIADDIRSICAATAGHDPLSCIVSTGDMTQSGKPDEFEAYLGACSASELPLIQVVGNHDWSGDKSGETWTRYMGPLYFSLDWGPVHLIAYDSTAPHYSDTLPVDEWLAADLALVPPERPIVVLIHHQFAEDFYARVRGMANPPRRIVASLSGHWHSSRLYDDGTTRHFNQPTTSMGGIDYSPRGYSVLRVDAAGEATLTRHLLGANSRARLTGIGSIEEEPPTDPDPNAAPVRLDKPWAQFHGDSERRGYIADGPQPPYRKAWQTRLTGGLLFGSPVIGDGAACIPTLDEQDPHGGHLVCVDAASGSERWRARTDGSVKHSVALDHDTVYSVNVSGKLTARDANSGTVRWAYQLGDPSERWMFSAPALRDGMIYTGHSQHFACVDAETGQPVWVRDDLPGADWISSYVCPALDDDTVYTGFFWHHETLWALDRHTGATRWMVEGEKGPAATPVLGDGVVYVTGHNGFLRALDAATGAILWEFDLEHEPGVRGGAKWSPGTPALGPDGTLYVPTGDGAVRAIDTSTGEQRWEWWSKPALAGVQGYARDGRSVLSSPLVSGDTVIVGASDGRIVALDSSDGTLAWSDDLGAPVISSPASSGNLLVCGASDGWLYAWTGA